MQQSGQDSLLSPKEQVRQALEEARKAGKADSSPSPVAPGPVTPAPSAAPRKSPEAGFDTLEMLGNAPGSFIKNAKAVLWDLPKEALGALKRYALDPGQYAKDLALVPKYLPEMKDAIKDDYADYYGNFGRRVSEDPFRLLSDVAGVAAIGGGTAASAGTKIAGALRATAPGAAKAAIAVGKAGRGLSKLAYLDPVDTLFGVAGKTAPALMESFGYGKYTPEIKPIHAMLDASTEKELQAIGYKLWFGKLSKPDRELLSVSFVEADNDLLETLERTRPDLWQYRQKMKDDFLDPDSSYWTKEEGIVKEGSARDAVAMGYVRSKVQRGVWKETPEFTNSDMIKKAHEIIDAKLAKPEYLSIMRQGGRGDDIFDVINEKLYNQGVLSRAERRASRGEIPTDIYQIVSHQARASLGAKKQIKLARAITELMAQKGELKAITKDMTSGQIEALRKAGYAPFKGPFWEKYFDTFGKAVNFIAEKVKVNGSTIANAADAAEEFKSLALKAEEMLGNPIQEVWAPKHVAAYLNQALNPTWADSLLGRGIRASLNMGGMLPYYKAIATVFNPRYYIANAVGNAALSFLYGVHPQALRYARKLHDFVPDEIANISQSPLFRHEAGLFMGTANKLAQYAQNIDNFFKRAVFINQAAVNGMKNGLLKAGKDFFVAEDALKAHLLTLKQAPNQYANNLIELTKAKEKIAAGAMQVAEANKLQQQQMKTFGSANRAVGREAGQVVDDAVYSSPRGDAREIYPAGSGPSQVPPSEKLVSGNVDQVYGGEYPTVKPITTEAKIAKAIERYDVEILELETAIQQFRQGGDIESLIDLLGKVNKQESDMLEALVHNPQATERYMLKLIDSRKEKIAKLKASPLFEAPAAPGPSATDDIYGGIASPHGGDKVYGSDLAEGPKLGPVESQPVRDAGEYSNAPGYRPMSEAQERLGEASRAVVTTQEALNQSEADIMSRLLMKGELEKLSPRLAIESRMADQAIIPANQFLGSYARLSPFERKILRQFIPFYTFTKAMSQLAFRLPFKMPMRQFAYLNLYRLWQDVMDTDSPRSSWFRNMTPVATLADGSLLMIRDGSFNPFANVRTVGMSGVEIPTAWDIFGSHPIFRLVLNGRGQLTPKPVSPGEKATRLDNGEVWEFTGKGFKRVIAQPSWAKALWSLFPQSQMIDSAFQNAVQSDRGFALKQDPILGPNGKPVFPLGWQERLLGTVVPTSRVNIEQLKAREMGKYRQIVTSYMEDMRRSPPAKRDAIRQVLLQLREDMGRKYFEY